MYLSDLLNNKQLSQQNNPLIKGLKLDSRHVQAGDLFFALAGTKIHGEHYIADAIARGAVAILKEAPLSRLEILATETPCLSIPHLSQHLGEIVARFYKHPAKTMRVTGVTGTNGKTSVSHFIAQLLSQQQPAGLIGTLGYGCYGNLENIHYTTPDALRLQAIFAELRDKNVHDVVMEVSSHALVQGRVNTIPFKTAVFTNLSRDHLDYHQTMEEYAEAKRLLFQWEGLETAVINIDDPMGRNFLARLPSEVRCITYGLETDNIMNKPMISATILNRDLRGCTLEITTPTGQYQVAVPIFGQFNISNILATIGVLLSYNIAIENILPSLSTITPVAGRMEYFSNAHSPTVIVDYAHTPDALQKVLLTLRTHCKGQLYCVFGCGGNRDRGKRPLMGEIVQAIADQMIITDDNPRHEESNVIIKDILRGCNPNAPVQPTIIPNREQAIHYAIQQAIPNDIVLIAGKGHEDYQEIGSEYLPFSDRALVQEILSGQ
ncbi:UDP-N-acetylmuramoyl-L-alanyl-D-glutamate--2,6-diaminopimelate ligase [Beggiatoa leptomitoformis]|uniref:UDP-N-acetylmuramoyl-L-alanyl-D-glutamate--2,6-diaminopimelate ligase n=1 Tax=Beggiatoa leptomitoformis TaxID=288004 RepID=A0A2N9YEW5_9GAMM|nr:UDP-N-acetylmuramoyl-L-alanyl-D-glutamate--2,6-diaminopimelate ligase [Beggiatoa leptomitoformis]ALG68623.1 UDP-N-acetylmuramoyl-L-alanyl-D-glutamate--2,6-diaminopimelate ligase [Beggiatoa leptomitoformis]AUI69031.1 UDP-N-acetylmuramoyl-L-alanyl-D-glutamate--2,6-diaminopimelate ligase [Beggiatoa leptomitoformis]